MYVGVEGIRCWMMEVTASSVQPGKLVYTSYTNISPAPPTHIPQWQDGMRCFELGLSYKSEVGLPLPSILMSLIIHYGSGTLHGLKKNP